MPARRARLLQTAFPAVTPGTPTARASRVTVAAAVAAWVALAALTGCSTSQAATPPVTAGPAQDGWHGVRLDEPYPKPTLALQDMNGRPFRIDRDTHRPIVLVLFGYTHCRVVCPDMLAEVAAAVRPLDPGTRDLIQMLFVTVDPQRDDGPTLRAYLARFDPTILGLRGPASTVTEIGEELGVAVVAPDSWTGDYSVPHGAQVVGFGPDGLAHLIWMPGTATADLRADLVRLASSA